MKKRRSSIGIISGDYLSYCCLYLFRTGIFVNYYDWYGQDNLEIRFVVMPSRYAFKASPHCSPPIKHEQFPLYTQLIYILPT